MIQKTKDKMLEKYYYLALLATIPDSQFDKILNKGWLHKVTALINKSPLLRKWNIYLDRFAGLDFMNG